MIKSFRHSGFERFFKTGSKAGIQPKHAKRLKLQLAQLDVAKSPNDMAAPGWRLHPLDGGRWSVWVMRISVSPSSSKAPTPCSWITWIITR
jgi:proteic killer suppression protein